MVYSIRLQPKNTEVAGLIPELPEVFPKLFLAAGIGSGIAAVALDGTVKKAGFGVLAVAGVAGYFATKGKPAVNETQEFPDPVNPGGQYADRQKVLAMVNRLRYAMTTSGFMSRCDTFKDFYEMTNVYFKEVASEFKRITGSTIRSYSSGQWFTGCSLWQTQYPYKVLERMDELQIP